MPNLIRYRPGPALQEGAAAAPISLLSHTILVRREEKDRRRPPSWAAHAKTHH